MGVLDAAMDLDLAHELLLGTTLRQTALLNNLGSVHKLCLSIYEFEALREATLPEELALHVAADPDLSTLLLELLLDNDLRGGGRRALVLALLAR